MRAWKFLASLEIVYILERVDDKICRFFFLSQHRYNKDLTEDKSIFLYHH